MRKETKALTQLFRNHSRILVFTGAGISTESGLSDYRSKGGDLGAVLLKLFD